MNKSSSKFHEDMSTREAERRYIEEVDKCDTRNKIEALWEEYEPIYRVILRKELDPSNNILC